MTKLKDGEEYEKLKKQLTQVKIDFLCLDCWRSKKFEYKKDANGVHGWIGRWSKRDLLMQ